MAERKRGECLNCFLERDIGRGSLRQRRPKILLPPPRDAMAEQPTLEEQTLAWIREGSKVKPALLQRQLELYKELIQVNAAIKAISRAEPGEAKKEEGA